MAYVDLNPVRAAMADTPETSDHTSIKERIRPSFDLKAAVRNQCRQQALNRFDLPIKPLLHFDSNLTDQIQTGLPFTLEDYLHLVDWTGRIVRDDKRGHIAQQLPPILERLSIEPEVWLQHSTRFEANYRNFFR